MKPCIIISAFRGIDNLFKAYDEHGGRIMALFDYNNLERYVKAQGYEPVPFNSRCGKTILDKVEGQRI